MQFYLPLDLITHISQTLSYLDVLEIKPLFIQDSVLLPKFESNIKSEVPQFMLNLLAFQFLLELPLYSNYLLMLDFADLVTTPSCYGNFSDYIASTLTFNHSIGTVSITSEFENMGPEFTVLETEIRRRHIKYPHLTREEIFEIMFGMGSDSTDMALRLYDDLENTPIDYSNLYNHNGTILDVTQLSHREIIKLATEVDDIDTFESLEHIRSVYMASAPTVKLYYPEPFIASPSFIHNDLGFLHILQYQYWLWFFFIFLIVFYFLSFLVVVRWCANRNQPRRETRGVSRSKCGDLITATVPVTWAISIIVSESTDATDYYDGFGTGELVVGVRAFQWGWEYYYPKSLDLNYNVKPSYSTFVGNSLKYNTATNKTLESNNVWKFYQNKSDDSIITPAHLLVLPLDNSKLLNFMDFNTIGSSTLKESNAFKKIRMYSKVYTTNLVHTSSNFTDKYIKLNSLFFNENELTNSLSYGLKRQHNLTASTATTSIYSTFLDQKSMDKFLNFTLQQNTTNKQTNFFDKDLNLWSKLINNRNTITSLNTISLLFNINNNEFNTKTLKVLATYPNIIKEMGNDSDKKTTNFPLRKLFNSKLIGDSLLCKRNQLDFTSTNALPSATLKFLSKTEDYTPFLKESVLQEQYKLGALNAFNQTIYPSSFSIRDYEKVLPSKSHFNISSGFNNLDSLLNESKFNNPAINEMLSFNHVKSNYLDDSFNLKASSRAFFSLTDAPIFTKNPYLNRLSFDTMVDKSITTSYENNKVENTIIEDFDESSILLNTSESDPELSALDSYNWNLFWDKTNPSFRLNNSIKSSLNPNYSYMPIFTNYYDYDFKNASALEMLEESFWESMYSSYNHLDYLNSLDLVNKSNYSSIKYLKAKYDNAYLNKNKNINHLLLKDLSVFGSFYANNIQMDDFISPANLIATRDFNLFPTISNLNLIDESYASHKYLTNLFNSSSSILLNYNTNFIFPQSYLSILNNFRGDFDDFSWYSNNIQSNPIFDINQSTLDSARLSNPISLRSTAKNSIVTYNAYQKVFRTRFEEGRSNTRLTNFADLNVKQPFMTDGRISFEKLLGKNKEGFYNSTFYTNNSFKVLNDLADANNSLNFYFFDFPFLLSAISDPIKSMWFDWYTKWSVIEVQGTSQAKYSTMGVPYNKKHFDYNSDSNFIMADVEGYFTRISKNRRNYLPLWSYSPYTFNKSNVWSFNNDFNLLNPLTNKDFNLFIQTADSMFWVENSIAFTKNTSDNFTPSFSNSQKSNWRPYASIQSYYYNLSRLTDILTHREYLYRQYLEKNNKIVNLPKLLTVNPYNPLISELKSSFLLNDPITYSSEYSREYFCQTLTFFKFLLFKEWVRSISYDINKLPINTNLVNEYLFFYFLGTDDGIKISNNTELYKNQFRPLKKGISNMMRLQGTNAVAMPIEIRLQILASSRDVIHSWAIPSAGIKIDCIPGYTSHRIMIFLTPGIYWGQCMEICGRYHHWMPIIVYFMKRDLFFLWCTHFMAKPNLNQVWDINDRQFADYLKFVSYDRTTWLTELGKRYN